MDIYGNTVGSRESLSNQQEAILIGKILGDGCLEKNGLHVRLKIEQTDKQKDYVMWTYHHLTPFVGRPPKGVFHSGRDKKLTKRWRFATLSHPLFNRYYSFFYRSGKKHIPQAIGTFLYSPLTLAVWYMDDGYLRTDKSGAYLCTSSFSLPEHYRLQQSLIKNFNIQTNIHFAGKYARLHIPSRSLRSFIKVIEPYVVPCFKYKLSLTP